MLWNLIQLLFTAVLTFVVVIAVILDSFGYAEGIEKHIPWLGHTLMLIGSNLSELGLYSHCRSLSQ
jgi:hypothetical protein